MVHRSAGVWPPSRALIGHRSQSTTDAVQRQKPKIEDGRHDGSLLRTTRKIVSSSRLLSSLSASAVQTRWLLKNDSRQSLLLGHSSFDWSNWSGHYISPSLQPYDEQLEYYANVSSDKRSFDCLEHLWVYRSILLCSTVSLVNIVPSQNEIFLRLLPWTFSSSRGGLHGDRILNKENATTVNCAFLRVCFICFPLLPSVRTSLIADVLHFIPQ